MGGDLCQRRLKSIVPSGFDRDRCRVRDLSVVVVVPRGHRVDHGIARIEDRSIGGVHDGPAAPGYQHGLDRIADPLLPLHVVGDGLSKCEQSLRGRIVGFAVGEGPGHGVPEDVRDRELLWVEVAHREIADRFAGGDHRSDFAGDPEDDRSSEPSGHGREGTVQIGLVAEIEGGGSSSRHGGNLSEPGDFGTARVGGLGNRRGRVL